ncbi:flp pilus-assembly TadE/G-like family protein, partial [Pseudonocardia sp. KRD-188]|nr:flp pilus-assembly TadE/G-like family protein [Pseudonocardia oceani]
MDEGFATVWAAGAVALLVGLLVIGLELGGGIAARHRAEAAADLAALAAAGYAVHGRESACARAAAVAAGTDARVRTCRLDGWDALVEVEADLGLSVLGPPVATARARAGPPTTDSGGDEGPGWPNARLGTISGRPDGTSGRGTRSAVVAASEPAAISGTGDGKGLIRTFGVAILPIVDGRWCARRRRCLLVSRRGSRPVPHRPAPRAAEG